MHMYRFKKRESNKYKITITRIEKNRDEVPRNIQTRAVMTATKVNRSVLIYFFDVCAKLFWWPSIDKCQISRELS